MAIPVTVFTGFLGSGKTTIIRNIVRKLPQDYKIVWLKNEYGSISVDTELARSENIAVKEMLNGCLCCVLVGKLENALTEILSEFKPQRIIIETSGTAYPAPIVWEIEKLPTLKIDGVVTVIDAVNFKGFHDTSYSAKLQAQYTDLFIINKVGLVDDHELETRLDDLYELNPSTPKIKSANADISLDLVFGLDHAYHEVSTDAEDHHHEDDWDILGFELFGKFQLEPLVSYLSTLDRDDYYRIKLIVKTADGTYLVNGVAGRITSEKLDNYRGNNKFVFMGRGIKQRKEHLQQIISGYSL